MPLKDPNPEFTKKVLKQVRQIEINTRRIVTDGMAGSYHSIFRGQGMDFEEVREYQAGDDVRNIDWNVTAKMSNAYVKQFREERDLTIILMVDLSASGVFGSQDQSKRELAAEVASVLAFSATKNNDNVGLLLFTDHVEQYIKPRKGRSHILRIIREMLYFEPTGKRTDISQAIRHFNGIMKKKAVVFLISDFLNNTQANPSVNPSEDEFHLLKIANKKHDLICFRITDPREKELPKVGIINMEDAETGEMVTINTNKKKVRQLFAKQSRERDAVLEKNLTKIGADILTLSTDENYAAQLRNFFVRRSSKK